MHRVPEVREAVAHARLCVQDHSLTWPFAVWGMDMVGKFKTAPDGYTHLLIAVDKFTKWPEAKPIKKCDRKTTTKFLRELIYRYGYPHNIITDNGTNFSKGELAEFCEDNGIRLNLASVAHPSRTTRMSELIRATSAASSRDCKCPWSEPPDASGRTPLCPLGHPHDAQLVDGLHPLLPVLRGGSCHANGHRPQLRRSS
jgi:hypothetical protein